MDKRGFSYTRTTEDTECPFCNNSVAKGVSVCGNCQAAHGTRLAGVGAFLMLPAVAVAGFAGLYVGLELKSEVGGWVVFLGIVIACGVGLSKTFTSEGWFR